MPISESLIDAAMNTHPAIQSSDAGIFLWMTYHAMKQAGLDTAAIFASVALPDQPPDHTARRANNTQAGFWHAAERISGDPDIGLHTGGLMQPYRGQVIEYLFLSSPTLGAGLSRALRYHRLWTDAMQMTLHIEGDTARIKGLTHPVRHYLECAIAVFLQFLKHFSEDRFAPIQIWLTHSTGASPAEYQRIYGCETLLGQPEGAIIFAASLLDLPSPAAEPQLFAVHDAIAAQYLQALENRDLIVHIQRELGSLFELGEVSLEHLAARLETTPRALRRELANLGTSFNEVVAQYRERLARRLLARTQESLDQIIYLTGYSEPAAFTRAFKRWTGETPTDYRKRKQSSA